MNRETRVIRAEQPGGRRGQELAGRGVKLILVPGDDRPDPEHFPVPKAQDARQRFSDHSRETFDAVFDL